MSCPWCMNNESGKVFVMKEDYRQRWFNFSYRCKILFDQHLANKFHMAGRKIIVGKYLEKVERKPSITHLTSEWINVLCHQLHNLNLIDDGNYHLTIAEFHKDFSFRRLTLCLWTKMVFMISRNNSRSVFNSNLKEPIKTTILSFDW